MSVIINGSTGITNVDGSAGTPANKGSTSATAGMFFPAANTVAFSTSSTEAMRIDSSQNVGIGTSSPAFDSGSGLEVQRADVASIRMEDTAHSTALELKAANGAVAVSGRGNYPLLFETNGNERVRIDSAGNVMFNTTSQLIRSNEIYRFNGVSGITSFKSNSSGGPVIAIQNTNGVSVYMIAFNNSVQECGTITTGSNSVQYNSNSDYRLKENVQPLNSGLNTISSLRPVSYKWKSDGSNGEGFIAHELQEVIPLAVTGEKDAFNEDGSIKPQGVDYSKIVVHLVAAIQEQQAQIEELKAKVATLEGK